MNERLALFARLERGLLEVEVRIGLLGRLTPRNFRACLEGSATTAPAFEYDRAPDLGEERRALETAHRLLEGHERELTAQLLAERIAELLLEIRLVEARGTPEVARLGALRFPYEEDELDAARGLAATWIEVGDSSALESAPTSGSEVEPLLLVSALAQHPGVKALGCEVREADIAAVAAVSDSGLLVRRGARVSPAEVERIFAHEVGAHWAPRLRARQEPPPFAIGTRASAEDEEGRAILLEERASQLHPERRRELAARYWAAAAAHRGATFAELLVELRATALPTELVRRVALRALRGGGPSGGGLGREVVYVAGYLRVKRALADWPGLESWMQRGRISVASARALAGAQS